MTDEERIVVRILEVIPRSSGSRLSCSKKGSNSSFELMTFLSLFRVRFSDKIATACVTCGESPELLLNKEFIEEHCKTDEHLFMLVMHELYHVILGHTRLFPRSTEVRNLVFDAVINALLCSLFPEPAFTSFFTDYYPADTMPFALLRPKGQGTPSDAEHALNLLYGGSDTGTYHDVYEALLKSGCVKEIRLQSSIKNDSKRVLLGSHGKDEEVSSEMKDLIREIIAKWPSPDRPLKDRDLGSSEREHNFSEKANRDHALQSGVRRLMRHSTMRGAKEVRRRSVREQMCEMATFLPDWRDRSHMAREVVFSDALIYQSATNIRRPCSRDNNQAFVYFDVSGSVENEVPSVAQALLPYCRRGLCSVYVFSTVVHSANARNLAARNFISTGGTDINCVMRHALSLPKRKRPQSVVVVTDGYVGRPNAALAAKFRAAGMRFYVGLVKSDSSLDPELDLSSLAHQFVKLFNRH